MQISSSLKTPTCLKCFFFPEMVLIRQRKLIVLKIECTYMKYFLSIQIPYVFIQKEVNNKVTVAQLFDGNKLIKKLSTVIRKRFADRITALQELKKGVEEDYARKSGKNH